MSQSSHVLTAAIHFSQCFENRNEGFYAKPGDLVVHTPPEKGVIYRNGDIVGIVVLTPASLEGFKNLKLLAPQTEEAPAAEVETTEPQVPQVPEAPETPQTPAPETTEAPATPETPQTPEEGQDEQPSTETPEQPADETPSTEDPAGETMESAPKAKAPAAKAKGSK